MFILSCEIQYILKSNSIPLLDASYCKSYEPSHTLASHVRRPPCPRDGHTTPAPLILRPTPLPMFTRCFGPPLTPLDLPLASAAVNQILASDVAADVAMEGMSDVSLT
jgi:hypothetical protein